MLYTDIRGLTQSLLGAPNNGYPTLIQSGQNDGEKKLSAKTDKYNLHEGKVQRFLLNCISCS